MRTNHWPQPPPIPRSIRWPPLSPRLRRLVIRAVELIEYRHFQQVGLEDFVALLNRLHVQEADMDTESTWVGLMIHVLESPVGMQQILPHYWELVVRLAVEGDSVVWGQLPDMEVARYLEGRGEWEKLEAWVGFVWPSRPELEHEVPIEEIGRITLTLFHHRPSAAEMIRRLERVGLPGSADGFAFGGLCQWYGTEFEQPGWDMRGRGTWEVDIQILVVSPLLSPSPDILSTVVEADLCLIGFLLVSRRGCRTLANP